MAVPNLNNAEGIVLIELIKVLEQRDSTEVSINSALRSTNRVSTRQPTFIAKDQFAINSNSANFEFVEGDITYRMLFSSKFRRTLITGIIVAICQQLTGINAIIIYALDIQMPGMNVFGFRFVVWLIRLIFSIWSLYFFQKFGRKTLLLAGYLCSWLWNWILFGLFEENPNKSESTYEKYVISLSAVTVITFIITFGLSVGPTSWVYLSETLPGRALGIATWWLWTTNAIIQYLPDFFYRVLNTIDNYYTFDDSIAILFFFFSGFWVLGYFLVMVFVQETKGIYPEYMSGDYDSILEASKSTTREDSLYASADCYEGSNINN